MALVLSFGCLLPAIAFLRVENRSLLFQRFLFIIGLFIGGVLPIKWLLRLQPKANSYALTLCLLAIIFLPLIIPFFVARNAGGEQIIRRSIAITVGVLLILNLLVSCF
jgi:hypothetical protein